MGLIDRLKHFFNLPDTRKEHDEYIEEFVRDLKEAEKFLAQPWPPPQNSDSPTPLTDELQEYFTESSRKALQDYVDSWEGDPPDPKKAA